MLYSRFKLFILPLCLVGFVSLVILRMTNNAFEQINSFSPLLHSLLHYCFFQNGKWGHDNPKQENDKQQRYSSQMSYRYQLHQQNPICLFWSPVSSQDKNHHLTSDFNKTLSTGIFNKNYFLVFRHIRLILNFIQDWHIVICTKTILKLINHRSALPESHQ